MMTCRELAELLIDFVSGELAPEHQERVEQHLGLCPPCVVFVETYKITIRLTRQLPRVPLPPGLERRLREALAEMKRGNPEHER
ncbi:MAG TPA: zf-HC2 domain-containing protein [Gemmataceae bacterium]|nr:zf-HC2 domain-containing protein [Gemmataceae bacterium]